jgi:hypothetical protein
MGLSDELSERTVPLNLGHCVVVQVTYRVEHGEYGSIPSASAAFSGGGGHGALTNPVKYRKCADMVEKRTERVELRLTEAERAECEAAARADDRLLASWVRAVVLRAARLSKSRGRSDG